MESGYTKEGVRAAKRLKTKHVLAEMRTEENMKMYEAGEIVYLDATHELNQPEPFNATKLYSIAKLVQVKSLLKIADGFKEDSKGKDAWLSARNMLGKPVLLGVGKEAIENKSVLEEMHSELNKAITCWKLIAQTYALTASKRDEVAAILEQEWEEADEDSDMLWCAVERHANAVRHMVRSLLEYRSVFADYTDAQTWNAMMHSERTSLVVDELAAIHHKKKVLEAKHAEVLAEERKLNLELDGLNSVSRGFPLYAKTRVSQILEGASRERTAQLPKSLATITSDEITQGTRQRKLAAHTEAAAATTAAATAAAPAMNGKDEKKASA